MGKEIWLRDRYHLETVLGEGAFGTVYLAEDRQENRKAALKAFRSFGESREGELLLKARGIPGVPLFLDSFQEEGTLYLAMEYLEGGSLKDYLKKEGTLADRKALELLLPVIETAAALHSRGIIHCDISPDNLIFDGEGRLNLIDFGAAVEKGESREEKELKAAYAPMELYQEKEKIGPWTDLYSICALWYEMVTGRKVPSAPERLQKDSLQPASAYVKTDPVQERAFLRGLQLEIQKRYFSGENLMKALGFPGKLSGEQEKAMRECWGELWIAVTTETERAAASGKAGERRRKIQRILAGAGIFAAAFLAAFFCFRRYLDTHPEKVLEWKLARDRRQAAGLEPKKIVARDSEEYREALAFLKEHAYESEEDVVSTYRFLPEDLKGWEYPGKTAGSLPVTEETAKLALDLLLGEEGQEERRNFNGFVAVYTEAEWYPVYTSLNWEISYSYGEDTAGIYVDSVTGMVTYLYISSGDPETIQAFLLELLPEVSPVSCLTEEETEEMIRYLLDTKEYTSIWLNEKCSVSLSLGYEDQITAGITAR